MSLVILNGFWLTNKTWRMTTIDKGYLGHWVLWHPFPVNLLIRSLIWLYFPFINNFNCIKFCSSMNNFLIRFSFWKKEQNFIILTINSKFCSFLKDECLSGWLANYLRGAPSRPQPPRPLILISLIFLVLRCEAGNGPEPNRGMECLGPASTMEILRWVSKYDHIYKRKRERNIYR